ncbi:MAG TPA: hypothetical protein VFC67_14715 [Prolixibacteraceae bacterium]|nr:hypothetical protein [Prolixibacteraceae bacterium]
MKNLISVTVPDEDQRLVLKAVGDIKLTMPFLTKLSNGARANLQMMNDGRKPFVEKCLDFASRNPNLRPEENIVTEGDKDIKLFSFLQSVENELSQILEMVRDTRQLAGSEAYDAGLKIYRKAKYNESNDVPGSKAIVEELGKLFKQGGSSDIEPNVK